MSEKLKSSNERAEELRKELLKLKDEEMGKIEKGGGDPDLIALRSEGIGGLGEEELNALGSFLALKRGVEGGYHFEEDEINDIPKILAKLTKAIIHRLNNFLAEEKKKLGRELTGEEKINFRQHFGNEDYVALYHRWLVRQFDKFFEDHPEYNHEERVGAVK